MRIFEFSIRVDSVTKNKKFVKQSNYVTANVGSITDDSEPELVYFTVKRIILFDIDLTLINTDEYRERSLTALASYTHKSIGEVEIAREQYINSLQTTKDFHPKELAKWMSMALGNNMEKLLDQIWNKDILSGLVYEEVEIALEMLSEENTLGIYSEGFDDFQKLKLEANGLTKYFNPKWVFITRKKLGDVKVNTLGKVTIVDDNIKICEMLNDYKDVTILWLNRKTNKKSKDVRTIFSLKELVNEIK